QIRWLFVIARNSTFTYKGQAVDMKRVGRELGVRYILEGSVRKAGGRGRITAQLIEVDTGAHLWADRFDGTLEDIFDLQNKVAISVAGVIEPALQVAETARSARRPTNDLTAYDLYLRSYAMYLSSARELPEALRLMEQAITTRAAGPSAAHSDCLRASSTSRSSMPKPRCASVPAPASARRFSRFDEAVANLLLAIQDDPSFADPYRYLAACYAHMGRLGEAREVVERLRAIT